MPQTDARPPARRSPWAWIPSLYFAQGLPNVLVTVTSVVVYKNLGLSNAAAVFYASCLQLPWVIKPLWGPLVDLLKTRREWIWWMQLLVGAGLAGVALTVPTAHFLLFTLALFWLVGFSSATHDIAADGFYILANTEHDQSFFSGVRSVSFNLAKITARGLFVALAGVLKERTGGYATAWAITFALAAGLCWCLTGYHRLVLPRAAADRPGNLQSAEVFYRQFAVTFAEFFKKPGILTSLCFLLFYRLGEVQLVNLTQPFLLDPRTSGGLGLDDKQLSFVYGTVGVIALICGGLLGGFVVSHNGLKRWLWPMALAIHLPDVVFVWLAHAQPENLHVISAGVAVEQFGYGFGFAAYMLYMIYIARGKHATAHYAICTGFMALGVMLPGMFSGWLQQKLGYPHFFVWVLLATIPGFIVTALIRVDADFGKRTAAPAP